MNGIGLEINKEYAKEIWDTVSIFAYNMDTKVDWELTNTEELDELGRSTIIYIENDRT